MHPCTLIISTFHIQHWISVAGSANLMCFCSSSASRIKCYLLVELWAHRMQCTVGRIHSPAFTDKYLIIRATFIFLKKIDTIILFFCALYGEYLRVGLCVYLYIHLYEFNNYSRLRHVARTVIY